ncbi:hypothetical protein [Rubrobacter marinus]|nr:hypothetical protein [Rubrobacter marinus]
MSPNRACDQCAAEYYVRPSTLRKGFGRYCSKHCSNLANNPSLSQRVPPEIEAKIIEAYRNGASKQRAGEPFGYGRGGVANVLKRNGIEPRGLSEANKGRVVSKATRALISRNHHDVSGKNNPMHGKPPGHGRREYVAHLDAWVRSSWEATVARALLSLGVPHEYERHRIVLGERTYLPDFYLPDSDVYIEVKGWANERWQPILDALALRTDMQLVVIGTSEYKRITARPEALRDILAFD